MLCHQYFTNITHFFAQTLSLHSIQDYCEVFIFITITYHCLIWLKQDHTKNLLLGSYAYMTMLLFSHLSSCDVLFSTLLIGMPICLLFAIVMHQKQLQKNFILSSRTNVNLSFIPPKSWLEELVQSCLIASHHKKNIICVIERTQHLQPLLQAPFMLQAPIQQDFIHLLLGSDKITEQSILWVHESGIMQSVNVSWNNVLLSELIIKPQNYATLSHEAALLLSEKTDALIFATHASLDTHKMWYQGSCIQHATTQQLLVFMNKILKASTTSSITLNQRNNHDQRNTASS